MFFELGLERRSREVGVAEARLHLVEQLDEVGLGTGDGDAVLLRQGLQLLDREAVEVADLTALKRRLELGRLLGLGLGLLLDGLRRQDAGGAGLRRGRDRGQGTERRLRAQLAAADLQRPGHYTGAAAVGVGGLWREPARSEAPAVEWTADRADPLILHRHPFELLDADLLVELDAALVVGAQHLGAGDHLHADLRLAKHLGAGVPEPFRVLHHVAEVADNALDALAGGDAAHHGAPDSVGQLALDVASEHQVVLAHEIERVGVDQGESARGELVDPLGGEVAVEGQLGGGEVLDAAGDALAEGGAGRLAKAQGLLPAEASHGLADVGLEFLEANERRQLVVRERAETLVAQDGAAYLVLGAGEHAGQLGNRCFRVTIPVADAPSRGLPNGLGLGQGWCGGGKCIEHALRPSVERRGLGIEETAGWSVERHLAAVHPAVVLRLIEMHAVVTDRIADIPAGAGSSPGGLRPLRRRVRLGVQAQHLLGALDAHDSGQHHVDHRLDLLGVEQIHRLTFAVPVGSLDVGVEVHLELEAGAADQLAVVKLDEQALEIDGVRGIEIVKQELERLALPPVQFEPVVKHPVENGFGGLGDLPDHHQHLPEAHRGGGEVGTVAGDQRS